MAAVLNPQVQRAGTTIKNGSCTVILLVLEPVAMAAGDIKAPSVPGEVVTVEVVHEAFVHASSSI